MRAARNAKRTNEMLAHVQARGYVSTSHPVNHSRPLDTTTRLFRNTHNYWQLPHRQGGSLHHPPGWWPHAPPISQEDERIKSTPQHVGRCQLGCFRRQDYLENMANSVSESFAHSGPRSWPSLVTCLTIRWCVAFSPSEMTCPPPKKKQNK